MGNIEASRIRAFGSRLTNLVKAYSPRPAFLDACPLLKRVPMVEAAPNILLPFQPPKPRAYSVVRITPIRIDDQGAMDTSLLDAKLPALARVVVTEIDRLMADMGRAMLRVFSGETTELPFAPHVEGAVFEHHGKVPHLLVDDGVCVLRVEDWAEPLTYEWRYRVCGDFVAGGQ